MIIEQSNVEKILEESVKNPNDLKNSFDVTQKEKKPQELKSESEIPYYKCCDNPDIIKYRGEYICKCCAVVHEPIMTYYYSNNLMNNTLHIEKKWNYPYQDHGCRTTFSLENLPANKRFLFWRLAKLNKFFNSSTEANMKLANQVLFKFASQLEIPKSIYRNALHIYQKVLDSKLTVGRGIKNLMVASLYIACNLNQFTRSLENFSKASQIPTKTIRKNYRLIIEQLNIKLRRRSTAQYITKFSIELGLSVKFQTCALQILKELSNNHINTSCNPKGFAAAIIYFISKKGLK
ncbi:MAG: hypothetical protein ACFFD2_08300, partial [Promethearchaeota archaeon]